MRQFSYFSKLLGAAAIVLGCTATAGAQTTNLTYTGAVQTYTVPAGVTNVSVEAAGGKGGDNNNWPSGTYPSQGGNGGKVICTLAVTGGQVLSVNIGGQGAVGAAASNAAGGYNGGGAGGHNGPYSGGGGGGATDISIGGTKVIIAGGGGGAGLDNAGTNRELGGAGGGLTGGAGYFNNSNTNNAGGRGGTQTAGGANGVGGGTSGAQGIGGDGYAIGASGGGGGGYYGGGGGGTSWAAGGGGSSFTDPALTSGVIHTQAANAGNGYAIITVLNANPTFVNGSTQTYQACFNATTTDVSSLLGMSDGDAGDVETFTLLYGPANGTFSGLPATLTATGGTDVPTGITYAPNTGYTGPDSFQVEVNDGRGGLDTTTVYITVNPIPDVAPTADQFFCNGAVATITFSGSVGGALYYWSNDNSNIGLAVAGATPTSTSFLATNTGSTLDSAMVIITPSANGCTGASDTFNIYIYPTPVVNATADQPVCNGSNTPGITFTGAVDGTTYDWTNDNTGIGLAASGTGDISSFTAVNTGTVTETATIIVTPSANGCTGTPDTFAIMVYPTPTVDASADQAICNGGATADILFTGTVSGTTFDWTNDKTSIGLSDLGTGDITTFIVSNTGTLIDTAHIVVTPMANGCAGTPDTFNIVVFPTPAVAPTADAAVCNGATSTAIAFMSAIDGTTYNWVNDNNTIGLALSGTGDITPFTAVNTGTTDVVANIIVTPTANGCAGTPDTFTITVYPTPGVNASADQAVCNTAATTAVMFGGTVAGTIYNWTNSNTTIGLSASGTGDIMSFTGINTSTVTATGEVIVTPVYNGCAGATDTFYIGVFPTPVVTPTADMGVCNGAATTAITFGGPVSGTIFDWMNDNTATGLVTSGTNVVPSFTAVNTGSTANEVSTIIVTPSANGCVGMADTFAISVYPTPVVIPSAPQTVCNGATTTPVTFTGTPAAVTYSWTNSTPSIGLATTGTGNIAAFTATNTGFAPVTATITVTPAANGCTGVSQATTIVVYPTPSLSTTLNPAPICDNAVFSYIPASAVTGATFAWSRPYVAGIVNLASSGAGNPAEALDNTTYTNVTVAYVYTITANSCSNVQTVNAIVRPTPTLSSDSVRSVCSGELFSYTPVSYVTSGVSFTWNRALVTGITPAIGTGSNNISETLTNIGTTPLNVNYIYTLNLSGCTNTDTVKLTVNPTPGAPSIGIKPAGTTLCSNTMFQNFGAAASASTLTWSAVNATVYATGNTKQYALVNFDKAGTAKVILTNKAGTTGCRNSDTATYTVGTSSTLGDIYVIYNNGQLICLKNDVDTYTWGYDDALTLDSTMIQGEHNANYFINALDTKYRNYWVITTKGDCSQKTYFNKPTGVQELNEVATMEMKAYPNPASDVINVEVAGVQGNMEVSITNMVGQKVSAANVAGSKATISIANLPAGMYVVDCYVQGVKAGTAKFVKN